MDIQLTDLITHLNTKYDSAILPGSRYILEVDLGREAEQVGYGDLGRRLRGVEAVVPVKDPGPGMKVLIDGRTFVNYAQYASGIAVPGHVARDIDLPATLYCPDDSLVRQFH
jgi:hypothetical protein